MRANQIINSKQSARYSIEYLSLLALQT
jgi:hypothetical protein